MILSDVDIRAALAANRLVLTPLDHADIQPASIDVHLGQRFLAFPRGIRSIDPEEVRGKDWMLPSVRREPFWLEPHGVILYELAEHLRLPDDLVARLEGKSSMARLGLSVHLTAGYVDPGWDGVLTLEIANHHDQIRIRLRPGMKIGQLSFIRLSSPVARPYGSPGLGSHYQGSDGVVASRYGETVP